MLSDVIHLIHLKKVLNANKYSNPIVTDFFSKFSYQNLIFPDC